MATRKKVRKKRRGTHHANTQKWPPNRNYPHFSQTNTIIPPNKTINRKGGTKDRLWPIEMAGKGSFLPWWVFKSWEGGKVKKKIRCLIVVWFEYFPSS
jgi:hypothetical protein